MLYLQHGGGEDETGWAEQGRVAVVLDNLIAAGKAEPMLVVMANGNVSGPGGARGYSSAAMTAFGDELLNNVVPFVEAHYRVLATAENRALAGLSMGGGQASSSGWEPGPVRLHRHLQHGTVRRDRPAGWRGPGRAVRRGEAGPRPPEWSPAFNEALEVLYISVGEQDPRFEPTKKAVADLRSHGLRVELASFPGAHEWQVWRKSLHDFAQRIFRR